MEKSAEKWGPGSRRRLPVGGPGGNAPDGGKGAMPLEVFNKNKNCIKQPCIFQFLTSCKTITF